jgi:FkbM family methyltransferase
LLTAKVRTARRLFHTAGLRGIAAEACAQARERVSKWWYRDRVWIGKLVTLTGNELTLDGCRFTLQHPLVTDKTRARFLRGRYERAERVLLDKWLDDGAPVVELGGGLGVVACIVNRRLQHPDRHVVLEANPSLIPLLDHHRTINGARFTIVHGAIDYSGRGSVRIDVNRDFLAGRVGDTTMDATEVPAVRLRDLCRDYPYDNATLVCDIEGVETQLVEHDGDVLARRFQMLVVETHPQFRSPTECAAMSSRLDQLGFAEVDTARTVYVYRRR